jgi:hypothetical protein
MIIDARLNSLIHNNVIPIMENNPLIPPTTEFVSLLFAIIDSV